MPEVAGGCLSVRPGNDDRIDSCSPAITVLNLPTTLAVDILAIPAHRLVGNDGEVAGWLVTEELLQQGADNGLHARRQNDNGNIVILGPVVEFLKVRVQLHVL